MILTNLCYRNITDFTLDGNILTRAGSTKLICHYVLTLLTEEIPSKFQLHTLSFRIRTDIPTVKYLILGSIRRFHFFKYFHFFKFKKKIIKFQFCYFFCIFWTEWKILKIIWKPKYLQISTCCRELNRAAFTIDPLSFWHRA